MKRPFSFWLKSTAFFLAVGAPVAKAQSITLTPVANNLYNTGYSGTALAGNNQADTHYALLGYGTGLAYEANPLANGWAANPMTSRWITVSPTTTTGPSITYDYRLTLTNIPVGEKVTLNGSVAADDNVRVSGSGSTPYFSNFSPGVVAGNYNSFTALPTISFISGTTNYFDFLVSNTGGGPTGLNLLLSGFYTPLTSTAGLDIQLAVPQLDPNQQATLDYINRINAVGVNNSCFTDLTIALLGLPTGDFGAAMDQLSPEKLAIFSSVAFNNASFLTQDLDDYLAHRRNREGFFQASGGTIDTSGLRVSDPTMDPQLSQIYSRLLAWNPSPRAAGVVSDSAGSSLGMDTSSLMPSTRRVNVFVQGDAVLAQHYSDQDLDHRTSTTSSVEMGADYQVTPNFLVGAMFDFSHTDAALDAGGRSATIDTYLPGIYASYAKGGWYGNAFANYGHNAYTEQRNIAIGAFNETATGAPQGDQETGEIDAGYDFHVKHWTFGPTAGLQYTHLNVGGFTETGGCSADLAVDEESADSFRSRLGGHASYEERSGSVLLTPFVDASWQHEFLDGARGITSSFSEIGMGDFTIYTPDPGRESALLSTGINIDIDKMLTVFVNYDVQIDPTSYFGQSILAGVKVAF